MITKAVFPVAGLGTRFLPATKANPKEMLPIVDKPLIQYAAEEAIEAGITELIFVTSSSKRAIEDHFDSDPALEALLAKKEKWDILETVRDILPEKVSCIYVRQPEALGLGHAVLCARPVVGDSPFAVILADDLIYHEPMGCMAQMVEVFKANRCSVLGLEEVAPQETDKYGIVKPAGEFVSAEIGSAVAVQDIVEKPDPAVAPSNTAVVGRYILTASIFDYIINVPKGAGGEYQLTDAIAALLKNESVTGYRFEGTRYDCGSKLGYLQATVEYALKHPELGEPFKEHLNSLSSQCSVSNKTHIVTR